MPEAFTTVTYYLLKFGPLLLFFALLLGIVGLPIPDEMLLMGAGFLVAHHKMNFTFTVVFALLGSMCGITVSYLLGRLVSRWFVRKYAKKLNITQEKIKLVKSWFSKIGKWVLIIGYYLPFFRHVVGFVAGGAHLSYKEFALYAYTGAFIWVSTFFSIGYFFEWLKARYF